MGSQGLPVRDRVATLRSLREKAKLAGGQERIEEQHRKGKLTARERLDLLFDPGTFVELDRFVMHRFHDFGMDQKRFLGDGVVTGYGMIDGRRVYAFSHDFTVLGGSLGEMFARKICKVMDLAMKAGSPIVGLNDSGGARIQEGVVSLGAYADIFFRNALASGVVPQISAIMGPCAGGAVYSPALTDFILMVDKTSHMFITGPDVVRSVLDQEVTFEDLGGASVHNRSSGVAHFLCSSDEDCLRTIKQLLSYIPSNNLDDPPIVDTGDDPNRAEEALSTIVPDDPDRSYDMKEVVTAVLDKDSFLEVHELWAPNIIIGFGRLDGRSVGVVANQPKFFAGALDINSSIKGARFVRTCDAFNIPIVTFVDVPGFLPGLEQEQAGIIRQGAKLLYAYCEATVPKLTVIVRKAYGGAYDVLGSKHVRADFNFAWPTAEIAVMGPEGAINIVFRKELAEVSEKQSKRRELVSAYREKFANPYVAAEHGYIDDVIEPPETRSRLISALRAILTKRESRPAKKHDNLPL